MEKWISVKITTKNGREYKVENVGRNFRDFANSVLNGGYEFIVFNDLAIRVRDVESMQVIDNG